MFTAKKEQKLGNMCVSTSIACFNIYLTLLFECTEQGGQHVCDCSSHTVYIVTRIYNYFLFLYIFFKGLTADCSLSIFIFIKQAFSYINHVFLHRSRSVCRKTSLGCQDSNPGLPYNRPCRANLAKK